MVRAAEELVKRFTLDVESANNVDLILAEQGVIPNPDARRMTVGGYFDRGAMRLVIPKSVAQTLGLPAAQKLVP